MAKKLTKKQIEQYEHDKAERTNIPHVGLVTPASDPDTGAKKKYEYDPHLDPQLQWAGKTEHTSFEVPTVSLHVHERIDPKTIIESVKKEHDDGGQMSMFSEKKPLREAIDFYKHKEGWTNRLIAGDSLLVMNSLLEKEGMAGKVQMVYFDPPYGIKYGSNFQPFVNKKEVKDGKDGDLSSEPEMIKAFRDTWELGIHSYLTYLRDRLFLAYEMLHETGSIFVQISDENLHHIRSILDEVFGAENFISIIPFRKKTMPFGTTFLEQMGDFIIWYGKKKVSNNSKLTKYHKLFVDQNELEKNNLKNKDLDFTERANFENNGASPFGIALKVKDYDVEKIPFKKVSYHQDWMEENMNIYSAKNSKTNLKEPSIFVVYPEIESERFETLSDLKNIPEEYALCKEFYMHPNGAQKITEIIITSTDLNLNTKTIETINGIDNLTVKSGKEHLMELHFDNDIQGKSFDLRPELQLIIHM